MANPHRGEVAFEVAGVSYRLAFTTNSICDFEDSVNLGIEEISKRFGGKMRISLVRAALWAGLQENHPEVTIKMAGELVEKLTVLKALQLVTKSMQLSFPQETAAATPAEVKPAADPPKPDGPKADGTGPVS